MVYVSKTRGRFKTKLRQSARRKADITTNSLYERHFMERLINKFTRKTLKYQKQLITLVNKNSYGY